MSQLRSDSMTRCPVCGQRGVGKVGAEQFYCWDCCLEFSTQNQDIKIFHVELDGTLTLWSEAAICNEAYLQPQRE